LATKWVSTMDCKWCQGTARVGIEKDGQGRAYRLICAGCGISEQAGMSFPAGKEITRFLQGKRRTLSHSDVRAAIIRGDPLPNEDLNVLGTRLR